MMKSLVRRYVPHFVVARLRGIANRRHGQVAVQDSMTREVAVIKQSGLFDAEGYLRRYKGVAKAGIDPVVHYFEYGATERKNPSDFFDTEYYLKSNPDVAAARINPFWHFCEFGWKESRNPSADFDTGWYWLIHLEKSTGNLNPLWHYQTQGRARGLEIRAPGQLSADDKQAMVEACQRLLQREELDADMATRIGRALIRISRWADAETAFRRAAGLNWQNPRTHIRLAKILARRNKWWQVVESLNTATALDARHPAWFYRLGEAREKMNQFPLAAEAYERAISMYQGDAQWYYRLGYAYDRSGRQERADKAYAQAIELDPRPEAPCFGIGLFHQDRGYWSEAADAYGKVLGGAPLDAALHFRQGMAFAHTYRFAEAVRCYEKAIALDPADPSWFHELGNVLERQGRWMDAAEAYGVAAESRDERAPCWSYRQAYVLMQEGCYQDAANIYVGACCEDFPSVAVADPGAPDAPASLLARMEVPDTPQGEYLRTLDPLKIIEEAISRDQTRAESHFRLGQEHERARRWGAAALAYAKAVERSNEHMPAWYYRLGFVLFKEGRHEEACRAFCETRILRRVYGVDTTRYTRNAEQRFRMEYNEYREQLPIRRDTVLYESFFGASVSDNPKSIFLYLLNHDEYAGLTHIWVIGRQVDVPEEYRHRANVIFVERDSDLYRRYLATCEILINNSTFPPWFIRRPEQKYLNTWHGTPIKSMGKDIRGRFFERKNTARNFLQCTHMISPNEHTSDILLRRYDIADIFPGKMAETGFPRIDQLINASEEEKAGLRAALGLTDARPVVLYAPTYRGTLSDSQLDMARLLDDMKAMSACDCQVVFRGHYFISEKIAASELPITIAHDEIDACALLSIVDVLVTDYSSISFDYMAVRKPIIYYAYDHDEYVETRGVYIDLADMPGTLCRSIGEVVRAISTELSCDRSNDRDYIAAAEKFCPCEDGQSARRVVEFLFQDSRDFVVNRYAHAKRSLLFYAGAFLPQGITASALNLFKNIDHDAYSVSLVIDPAAVSQSPEKLERFNQLPEEINVIGRCGAMVLSPEEQWVRDNFNDRRDPALGSMAYDVYQNAFRREYARLFGDAHFDCVIQFDGYGNFWTSVFGLGARQPVQRIIYLHNDMKGEFITRFPHLEQAFFLYQHYDKLVSVSDSVNHANREHLSDTYALPLDKFSYCDNVLDAKGVIEKSEAPLDRDLSRWIGDATVFGTIGRLSPEKDHRKLIRAFHALGESGNVKLVVVGDGVLMHELQALVRELGMEDRVRLAGQLANPYPVLKRMDLFVFSSNYEGQGIAILEALILGKPVVATDVVGSRTVLAHGEGLLVENSETGLTRGMRQFLDQELSVRKFDVNAYNQEALRMFHDMVDAKDAVV